MRLFGWSPEDWLQVATYYRLHCGALPAPGSAGLLEIRRFWYSHDLPRHVHQSLLIEMAEVAWLVEAMTLFAALASPSLRNVQ